MQGGARWKTQTSVYNPETRRGGNCTQAAVASILDLPLEEVPDFNLLHEHSAGAYWSHLESWLLSRGYQLTIAPPDLTVAGYYLAAGPSPRGVSHMVVMRNGVLHHDPHPSRAGIDDLEAIYLLHPRDPAELQLRPN